MDSAPGRLGDGELRYPDWFLAFLADRAIRKPSPHTTKAYRQDFVAIAALLAEGAEHIAQLGAGRDYEGWDASGIRRLRRHP